MPSSKLGDYVQFEYGGSLPARDRVAGCVPVYGSAGKIDTHNSALVNGPGVIVGRKGTIGTVHWADKDFYPIDTTYYVTPKSQEIRLRYIYYLLKTLPLEQMNTDAAVPGLNRTNALGLMVTVPPLAKQERIAAILAAYDDLIENNHRRIQLLEQSAKLLYQQWFVHFRFPGCENIRIVDGIPKGWKKTTLGDAIEIKKGKNITKNTVRSGDVPVVAGGIKPAYFHDTSNVAGPVVTISASGNAGYVNLYYEDIWASDCSYINGMVTEYVYYYYLLFKSKQKTIFGLQRGSAQQHVYSKDLNRLFLVMPPESLVDLFEQSVSKNFQLIGILIKQNRSLTRTRDLLIPRLMNEEITV